MTEKLPDYYSFLLRLWVVNDQGKMVWRGSLENPLTKEIVGFGSIHQLLEHLECLTDEDETDNEF